MCGSAAKFCFRIEQRQLLLRTTIAREARGVCVVCAVDFNLLLLALQTRSEECECCGIVSVGKVSVLLYNTLPTVNSLLLLSVQILERIVETYCKCASFSLIFTIRASYHHAVTYVASRTHRRTMYVERRSYMMCM